MQPYALTDCTEVAWTGSLYPFTNSLNATNAAHTSAAGTAAPNTRTTSPYIDPVNGSIFPMGGGVETRFAGIAEPASGSNVTLMRLNTAPSLTKAANPLLWNALEAGGAARFVAPYWRHAGAMSANPGVRLSLRGGAGTNSDSAGNLQGSYVYDMTGDGYDRLILSVPDGYSWATYVTPGIETMATPAGTTVNLQTVALDRPILELDGPGIVYCPIAGGGWSIIGAGGNGGWLDLNVIPLTFWKDYIQLFAEYPIFWIDLGTNNAGSLTQAQHAAALTQLIGRLRSQWPLAPIVLSSAFASSTSGSNPYYRAAAADVASDVPGVLYLDTYGAMPSYADGVTAGYYSDTVHYNVTGNHALWATIGNLIGSASL